MAEVDEQALPSNVTLIDCLPDLNTKLNAVIQNGFNAGYSGYELVDHVYDELGHASFIDAEIETWIKEKLPKAGPNKPGKIYLANQNATKYQSVGTGALAPIILCNGIRMGGDKVGHFFQLGYRLFYRQTKAENPVYGRELSEKVALKYEQHKSKGNWHTIGRYAFKKTANYSARFWGFTSPPSIVPQIWNHEQEMGTFGLKSSGVYSPADIAANNAGYLFYKTLVKMKCGSLNLGTFIDRSWSETNNPSKYKSKPGQKVWKNLLLMRNWSIEMKDKAGNILLKGQCKFTSTGITYTAKIVSGAQTLGTLSQLKIEWRNDRHNMLDGVIIDGKWSNGTKNGSLSVRSDNESKLRGAWAFGDPVTPDGFCTITC